MRLDCYTPSSNITKYLYHTAAMSFLGLPTNTDLYTILNSINASLYNISISIVNDKNYIWDQPVASGSWSITHGLNKRPAVTIVTTSGDEVEGDVNHVDNNNVTITFSAPFAGKAYFN